MYPMLYETLHMCIFVVMICILTLHIMCCCFFLFVVLIFWACVRAHAPLGKL